MTGVHVKRKETQGRQSPTCYPGNQGVSCMASTRPEAGGGFQRELHPAATLISDV